MLIQETFKEKVVLIGTDVNYWKEYLIKHPIPIIVLQDINEKIEIVDGVLKYEDETIELAGKTCVEIVKYLQDQGSSAVLTNSKVALVPAILLQSFNNSIVKSISIDRTPFNLYNEIEEFSRNIFNIESVSFELLEAYDDSQQVPLEKITLVNGNLYVLDIGAYQNLKCLVRFHLDEFSFNAEKNNLINAVTELFKIKDSSKQTDGIFKKAILDSNNNVNG